MADANATDTETQETKVVDDQKNEAQAKATARNEAEKAKWADDFPEDQLTVEYKREDKDDAEKKSDTATVEDSGDSDESSGTEDVQTETYAEPAPVVTVEDPGEYKPADYSFTIDIKGKTHTVDSSDKAAELAEEFAEDLTAKQLVSLITRATSIESKVERDKEKWQQTKDKFDEQSKTEKERIETVNTFANEISYLEGKGLLPKVAAEFKDADWQDPQVAKQPGVKEQVALLNYMVKENEARAKVGIKQLTSLVDAFNAWQSDEGRKSTEAQQKQAGEQRKAAGAKVAGVSPSANTGISAPKGIAVGNPNVLRRHAVDWDD